MVDAQVSGYMGKRFSLDYAFGTGIPHLHGIYANNTEESTVPIFKHKLTFDYTTSVKNSVGITYKFSHAKVRNDYFTLSTINNRYHTFQNHEIGPYIRVYLGERIAPLGFYFQFGVNFEVIFLNNLVAPFKGNGGGIVVRNYYQFDANMRTTFGRSFILFDRMKLGFDVSSSLGALTQARALFKWGESIQNTNKASNNVAYYMNYADNILEISVSVGLLGF